MPAEILSARKRRIIAWHRATYRYLYILYVCMDSAHHITSGRNVDDETGLSGNYTQIKKYISTCVCMFKKKK